MAEKKWGLKGTGREEMRELSVKTYNIDLLPSYQSITHKSFSSQTLGKQGWEDRYGEREQCSSGVVRER